MPGAGLLPGRPTRPTRPAELPRAVPMDVELADMLGNAGFSTWYSCHAPHTISEGADDIQGEREQAGDAEDAEVGEPVEKVQHRADGNDRGNGEDDERDWTGHLMSGFAYLR